MNALLSLLDDTVYLLLAITTVLLCGVAFALSRNVYREALRVQARSQLRREDTLSWEQQNFLRSMQAEEKVEEVLRKAGWTDVFLRRRVAVARLGHNREIDVVAVGPIILVVEVKNWQGHVWSKGSRWFQCRNFKRGDTLEFEDVQQDNVEKAAALRRYIENARRVQLPDSQLVQADSVLFDHAGGSADKRGTWYSDKAIHKVCGKCVVPVVVFTHPKVRLDPATIQTKKYVFTLPTLAAFAAQAIHGNIDLDALNDVATTSRWSWVPFAPRSRQVASPSSPADTLLNEDQQDAVAGAVDVLRTWDLIYLLDGRLITGDLQKIEVPSAFCMYERKHLLDINVRWNSGALGMVKTFLTNNVGTIELVLTTAKRLAKKRKERKPRNADGNIVFPMKPKKKKENDYVVMKLPGTAKLETVLLCDVDRILLSHHLYESEKQLE
ncbi:Nuclease-related domain containing protein [Novymonas esmeraldas]|uniref:Nuclease-related domain containing protein n=1 Tax=Novymonas esmeraldas TaxID=1808958 RepID=A0AAW0ELN3_9TRYP